MAEQTFVYESDEVRKTGRTASRKSPVPGRNSIETLVEIEPANVAPNDFSWKKWVPEKMLFQIEGTNK